MNKYQKLMGNTLIFGVGQLLSKLVGFLLTGLYLRCIPKEEFNTAELIYSTVNMLVPMVTFSMADAVIRFGMAKEYDKRKIYTCACLFVLGGMSIFMLFTPLVANISKFAGYSFLLYVYCYFSCFRQIASQFVRAQGAIKLYLADGVFAVFVQLIVNLIMVAGLHMGVTGYVMGFIISDAISLAMLTVIARLGQCLHMKYFDRKIAGEMLRFAAPLIPTYMLWWVTSSSDRWFMTYMVGEGESGIYSSGYKLPTLLMLVTTIFYQAWQMSSIEERNSRTLGKFYENVFGAYTSLMFIAAAGLIMLIKPLTFVLTGNGENGKDYFTVYPVVPILVAAMLFQCFCQFLSSVYTTKKRSVNSCVTALIAAVVNIILNIVLIPKYGMYGAAIATAAAYFACFAVRLFDARQYIFFKVDYLRLIVNTGITVFMCVLIAKAPKLWVLWVILCFAVSLIYNMDAVIKTLRKILSRGTVRQPQNAQGNAGSANVPTNYGERR
ncbi:MAG: oligosaccharide flippase family protein [Oscillospiraceae bacterium]|nr:oligosaccharide flippase family protein [Oscillospiraceae bacterium]